VILYIPPNEICVQSVWIGLVLEIL